MNIQYYKTLWTIDTVSLLYLPGLAAIHNLTSTKKYTLRIDLTDFDGATKYAKYKYFAVASEADKYKLTVASYSGTAGDYDSYFPLHCSQG